MAHRLYETKGKCENIHGHSWWATLELVGEANKHGLLAGLDFGLVKGAFRYYLDTTFDHRVLLNVRDPFAGDFSIRDTEGRSSLPGLQMLDGDPTTENLAQTIGQWCLAAFGPDARIHDARIHEVRIELWETSVNCATWRYNGRESK